MLFLLFEDGWKRDFIVFTGKRPNIKVFIIIDLKKFERLLWVYIRNISPVDFVLIFI